jgi:galactose mutarotase-like enzyme
MHMLIKLDNGILEAAIKSHGAELSSLKKDGTEYMWQADKKIWGRHAPVLFPIVGRVKNNKYRVGQKEYELFQHGFARDMEFELTESGADFAVYRLKSSEDTLLKYPYNFQLDICYTLYGSSITEEYRVKNMYDKPIYFSIGAHPGFNCPLADGETVEDYYLQFEQSETGDRYYLENGLIARREAYLENTKVIPLTQQLFADDALIFKNLKSVEVALKSRKSNKFVNVRFAGFPYLGIWSKPGGAPFVCLEPWCGVTDSIDHSGILSEKEGIYSLEPGQEFRRQFSIEIG